MHRTIGFIGGGNMAASLIGGLIADGWPSAKIYVSDPDTARREHLSELFAVHTEELNERIIEQCQIVLLAVKPQMMASVISPLKDLIKKQQPLLITIAAGICLSDLSRWCDNYHQLIRSMPNTPALLQSGATALYADPSVSEANKDIAETVMRAVGLTIWVEEEAQMDAVTALSGSGPAYFFYVMQAMEQAGVALGLTEEIARLLTIQTAFGAAKMAMESNDSPEQLRNKVTSPGGTTEEAIRILQENALHDLFNKAIQAAHQRSELLAKEHGLQS